MLPRVSGSGMVPCIQLPYNLEISRERNVLSFFAAARAIEPTVFVLPV